MAIEGSKTYAMKEKQIKSTQPKSMPQERNSPKWDFKVVLWLIPILLLTYLSLSPITKFTFLSWDDNVYVFENPNLVKPYSEAISYFFQQHYFIGNYIPVTMLTYAFEYHQVALDPPFYHTFNLIIHLLNVALVFWFIYLLSNRKIIVAAFVALFFGIHPMHIESVAWVAELKDVLYSFFFLGGLICYYKYLEITTLSVPAVPTIESNNDVPHSSPRKKGIQLLAFTFLLFLISVLSKPAAVIFPLVLLLVDYYSHRKFTNQVWIEKIPFFIISVILGLITIKAQAADHLVHDYYPITQRFFFACHSFLNYLVHLFVPFDIAIYHPYPKLMDGHLPYLFYIAPIGLLVIGLGLFKSAKQTRLLIFGFLFFAINLLLVLQLLSVGDAISADRYTYLPYIGLLFILGMGFDWAINRFKSYKPVLIGIVTLITIGCSYVTYSHSLVWENDETIANDLLDKYPDDRLVLNNKGFNLFNLKRNEESLGYFIKAIELKPDYIMAYINLANSCMAIKKYDTAEKYIDRALKIKPDDPNLINIKGYILLQYQKFTESINLFQKSIQLKKDNPSAYLYLAECYYAIKDKENWIKTLNSGLEYAPDNFMLLNNKGYALMLNGQYTEAIYYLNKSIKINPNFPIAQQNLANCYRAINTQGTK